MVVLGISALLVVAAGADGERTLSIRAVMHKQYTPISTAGKTINPRTSVVVSGK